MDLGTLPDMAAHFFHAITYSSPVLHMAADAGANIWTAITVPEAMNGPDRSFQLLKIAGATFGLCMSLAGGSIEGATGCAITDCEALLEMNKAGGHFRHAPH